MMSKSKEGSAPRLITKIQDLLDHLSVDLQDLETYWYRGHGEFSWKLLSFLGRITEGSNLEQMLLTRFKQNAALLLSTNAPSKEWEWMTVMQHHGVPTRLLDWTESPLIALYFVVSEEKFRSTEGALWVLRPTRLNEASNIQPNNPQYIPSFDDEPADNYLPETMRRESMTKMKPIALVVPRNTPRMQAQLGTFTVMHREAIAIEDLGANSGESSNDIAFRYRVSAESKEKILDDLQRLGVGRFQLFPELQSLGEILKRNLI